MISYNSDLEQKLFASLTTREASGHRPTRSKQSVRFPPGIHAPERSSRKKLVRDSQKSRESVGLPGSKRHNRYRNKMDLLDKALSDSESELEIEVELTVEFRSPFSILFTDSDCKKKWEPFVDITEEEQSELLSRFYPDAKQTRPPKRTEFSTAPQDRFNSLNRDERKLIKKYTGDPIIERFESLCIDLILSRQTTKNIKLTNFECLILGLVGTYFSLSVTAQSISDEEAMVTVYKQKGVLLPSVKLSEYLFTLQNVQ